MEIISTLLLALSPLLIKGVTNAVKYTQTIRLSDHKASILRLLVAVLSLFVAVGTAMLGGEAVDENLIKVVVEAFLVFLSTTGVYFLQNRSTN